VLEWHRWELLSSHGFALQRSRCTTPHGVVANAHSDL
jgi:hypothetical protein